MCMVYTYIYICAHMCMLFVEIISGAYMEIDLWIPSLCPSEDPSAIIRIVIRTITSTTNNIKHGKCL